MAADSEFTPVVARLSCLRGVSTLTAFGLATEIGDWTRLSGRSIGAYLGLVPCEYSSGSTRVQGGVTKTGNGHARRLLVESACITAPRTGPAATFGVAGRPPARQRAPADTPPTTFCIPAGRASTSARSAPWVANAAIARELAGWCWSLAILDDM